eukprot:TRINITY_DN24558_c0_g1_i1.p1 TRINITY_DN24558_c0_g1~~TRINITY_DN24558_c0_g1_i1.p1  ORF type:complete len:782 (+),score=96.53 TRINITY_DN24558_c0_g1_i1:285-2630(+)
MHKIVAVGGILGVSAYAPSPPGWIPASAECKSLESCIAKDYGTPAMYLQLSHVQESIALKEARQHAWKASVVDRPTFRKRQAWIRSTLRNTILHPLEDMFNEFKDFEVRSRWTKRWADSLGFRGALLTLETRPNFHIPCALFIPERQSLEGRVSPGVLFANGHDAASFREPESLRMVLNLVLTGMTVLTCDPMSQGERHQYSNSSVDAPAECVPEHGTVGSIPSCTEAHNVYGQQAFLLNATLASFFVWDAMKALDFLEGITSGPLSIIGCSGGGDLTAYVAAVDERVNLAVVACWFTSWYSVLDSQVCMYDAEQLWPGGLRLGLDKADILAARAPKPTMVLQNLQDGCFPYIEEARSEVEEAYQLFDKMDHIWWQVEHGHHGWMKHQLQPVVDFFGQAYGLRPVAIQGLHHHYSRSQLQITSTGQLYTDAAYSGATYMPDLVHSLYVRATGARLEPRSNRYAAWLREIPSLVSKIVSAGDPEARLSRLAKFTASYNGSYNNGYIPERFHTAEVLVKSGAAVQEQWVLKTRGACTLTLKVLSPAAGPARFVVLLISVSNMWSDALDEHRQDIAETVLQLNGMVVGVGLCGVGGYNRPAMVDAASFLFGESIVAFHADEILKAVYFVEKEVPGIAGKIVAVGLDDSAPALLHAAVLSPGSFQAVALVKPLVSYARVAASKTGHRMPWHLLIYGILLHYDLPDLVAALRPKKLLILSPVDEHLRDLGMTAASEEYLGALLAYQQAGAPQAFRLSDQTAQLRRFLQNIAADSKQQYHLLPVVPK